MQKSPQFNYYCNHHNEIRTIVTNNRRGPLLTAVNSFDDTWYIYNFEKAVGRQVAEVHTYNIEVVTDTMAGLWRTHPAFTSEETKQPIAQGDAKSDELNKTPGNIMNN